MSDTQTDLTSAADRLNEAILSAENAIRARYHASAEIRVGNGHMQWCQWHGVWQLTWVPIGGERIPIPLRSAPLTVRTDCAVMLDRLRDALDAAEDDRIHVVNDATEIVEKFARDLAKRCST